MNDMTATRVMVVEDEGVVALNLRQRLEKLGYDVPVVVSSGKDALKQIQEIRPDIVLMDIRIDGEMDGIETASRIPPDFMTPVIYLTAYAEESTLERARATKPYGYLLKPFSERELHATIKMALERRASDCAVHESEERLRLALAAAEMGSWEVDIDSQRILHRSHSDWLNDSPRGLVAQSVRDFLCNVHPDDRDRVRRAFDYVATCHTLCEVEFRKIDDTGRQRWLRVVGKAFYQTEDRRQRIVGVVRDVTDSKEAEAARRASERSYREIISSINGIVWESDWSKDQITYISDSVERILGYSPAQWMSEPRFWERHIHPEDEAAVIATSHSAADAARPYDSTYRMLAAGGRVVWIHEVVSMVTRSDQTTLLRGVMVDVTKLMEAESEREKAAERLAESESRLKAILDTAAVGIVTVDAQFLITRFNREAERMFGYAAEEMLGLPLHRLIPGDLRQKHDRQIAEFAAGGDTSRHIGDWRMIEGVTRDGCVIPLDIVISRVSVGGKLTLTAILRDMTDLRSREEELKRLLKEREVALEHAEAANRAKSSFLAVMSHELRTPLNAIIGFSDIMKREVFGPVENDRYRQYASDIHESGSLLLNVVNSILDLSRIESGKQDLVLESIELGDCWKLIAHTLDPMARQKGITLIADSPPTLPFRGDRQAVLQVLMNLVTNAIKFSPGGGKVEVGCEAGGAPDEVVLYVRDHGRGIPADRLHDIFMPFVQVSDSYARDVGGVGLGLAICKSLVAAMAGRIEIESELGRGTTVRVFLPAATRH
ncbi:MAG: PAS domain S-box protein [Rhodospirillaceae bacterium]|nr:PAS domain S-box protein [Rhodospirillaceae bacterium]